MFTRINIELIKVEFEQNCFALFLFRSLEESRVVHCQIRFASSFFEQFLVVSAIGELLIAIQSVIKVKLVEIISYDLLDPWCTHGSKIITTTENR